MKNFISQHLVILFFVCLPFYSGTSISVSIPAAEENNVANHFCPFLVQLSDDGRKNAFHIPLQYLSQRLAARLSQAVTFRLTKRAALILCEFLALQKLCTSHLLIVSQLFKTHCDSLFDQLDREYDAKKSAIVKCEFLAAAAYMGFNDNLLLLLIDGCRKSGHILIPDCPSGLAWLSRIKGVESYRNFVNEMKIELCARDPVQSTVWHVRDYLDILEMKGAGKPKKPFLINKDFLPSTCDLKNNNSISGNYSERVIEKIVRLLICSHLAVKYPELAPIIKREADVIIATQLCGPDAGERSDFRKLLLLFHLQRYEESAKKLTAILSHDWNEEATCVNELKELDISGNALALIVKHKTGKLIFEQLHAILRKENLRALGFDESAVRDSFTFDLPGFKERFWMQINPSDEYKRRMAFEFLKSSKPHDVCESVLDEKSWTDLEVFCGQSHHAQEYVASRLPTVTELGHVFLLRRIANCSASMSNLNNTRNSLRLLGGLRKNGDYEKVIEALRNVGMLEAGIFSFWDNNEAIMQYFDQLLYNFQGLNKSVSSIGRLSQWLNGKPSLLWAGEIWSNVVYLLGPAIGAWASGSLFSSVWAAESFLMNAASLLVIPSLLSIPSSVASIPQVWSFMVGLRIYLRLKLMHLGNFFKAIDDLRVALEKFSDNELFLRYAQDLDFGNSSPGIRELRTLLKASTFEGEPFFPQEFLKANSIFLHNTGNILAAFNLMRNHKQDLSRMLSAIAELDILVSTAALVRDKQGYCIPTILENNGDGPIIQIKGSWNPLLAKKTAPNRFDRSGIVENDLEVDSDASTIIINGPNAGGKSSIMRAIVIAIILAQSVGVAPARSLKFTPFSKIQAYLNIVDDQVGGNSLFMAAVKRALEVHSIAASLENGYSLSCFDEIFNGTSLQEGEAAALTLIQNMVEQKHNLTLATTHLKALINLGNRDSRVKNYMVTVGREGGRLIYPFTLVPGISHDVVAFQILAEQGFAGSFIEKCENNLRRLKAQKDGDEDDYDEGAPQLAKNKRNQQGIKRGRK